MRTKRRSSPPLIDPIFGCELATGRLDPEGYAYCGKSRAHLVAWIARRGPIPDEMEIDHLCRRRHCRAIHHLELVTRSENERRKSFQYRLKRVTCGAGHPLRMNRMITSEGGILCRRCMRVAMGQA